MFTFGVSPCHDSSVCLCHNGQIVSFYKEERLSKKKRDKAPFLSIDKSLSQIKHIDYFVYCAPSIDNKFAEYLEYIEKKVSVANFIDISDKHHLQHASLAFYSSGFDNAAVIVIDRNGSILNHSCAESETIFFADYNHEFQEIYKSYAIYNSAAYREIKEKQQAMPNCEIVAKSQFNLTRVYESATSLIMQHPLENGKTMGLSAYGLKDKIFPNLFFSNTNIPNDYYFSREDLFGNYESIYTDYSTYKNKDINKDNYQFYADYAWQVQKQTQEAVCFLIQKAIDKLSTKNICITGGYGLNIVSNAYYTKQFPNINFYFEPLADDSGNSIGGAILAYRKISQDKNKKPMNDTFFNGEVYDLTEINGTPCNVNDVCKLLLSQKSLGIYFGKAEAGPRALGHRSILFDARNPEAKKIINQIKRREWYRPFAAIMLEEDAHRFFDVLDLKNTEFMTVNCDVKILSMSVIPGVVHFDNTCRIQIVKNKNEPIYKLLTEFKNLTGVGLLLNTSLNLAGDPLAETPSDAINILKSSNLDCLWFPEINQLLDKSLL